MRGCFPHSVLPRYCRFAFCTILSLAQSIVTRRIRITHQMAMLTRAIITSARNATATIQPLLKGLRSKIIMRIKDNYQVITLTARRGVLGTL